MMRPEIHQSLGEVARRLAAGPGRHGCLPSLGHVAAELLSVASKWNRYYIGVPHPRGSPVLFTADAHQGEREAAQAWMDAQPGHQRWFEVAGGRVLDVLPHRVLKRLASSDQVLLGDDLLYLGRQIAHVIVRMTAEGLARVEVLSAMWRGPEFERLLGTLPAVGRNVAVARGACCVAGIEVNGEPLHVAARRAAGGHTARAA